MSLIFGVVDGAGITEYYGEKAIREFALSSTIEQITDHKFCIMNGVRLWSSKQILIQFGGIYAAFAGRCYNATALAQKQSNKVDISNPEHIVEVLAKGFLAEGDHFLKQIDGAFSLAIYQSSEKRLTLINDLFGFYPLFYSVGKSAIAFCNEYEPLLQLPFVDKAINQRAVADILKFGLVTGNRTLLSGIQQMPPATVLTYDASGLQMNTYSPQNHPEPIKVTLQEASRQLATLVSEAVAKRIVNFENVTADISGGIDTRLIVSSMTPELRSKVRFETMVTPPLTADTDRDVIVARQIAEALNIPLHIGRYNFWDSDFGPDYYRNWRQDRYDYQHIKGLFGGEFMNGDAIHFLSDHFLQYINGLYKPAQTTFCGDDFETCLHPNFISFIQDTLPPTEEELRQAASPRLQMMQAYSRSFFTNIYGGTRSLWVQPFTFLTKVDTPFLDASVIKYLLKLPSDFLGGEQPHPLHENLFRVHFNTLNTIPTTSMMALSENSCVLSTNLGVEAKNMRTIKTTTYKQKVAGNKSASLFKFFSYDHFIQIAQQPDSVFVNVLLDLSAWLEYTESNIINNLYQHKQQP